MKPFIVALMCVWTGAVLADELEDIPETREALIAQIVAGGTNESAEERHAVEIAECQLTTFRWRKQSDGEWVLWTSFELPLLQVDFQKLDSDTGRYFVAIEHEVPQENMVVMTFKTHEGIKISHEKPFVRSQPKGEFTLSDRGDGASFFKEWKSSGAIIQQGPDVIAKAAVFTNALHRYQQKFCTFIG